MAGQYEVVVDPDEPNNPHAIAIGLVGSSKNVLEVGCAAGHVTRHLVAAGNSVVGVEINAEDAATARRFTDTVHEFDLDGVAASSVIHDEFDVIVLGDVLEHLRDPVPVLADLTQLLADDGYFVISVPHVGHIDVRLHLLGGKWEYQDDGLLDRTHLRWFTRDGLRDTLGAVGLVATALHPVVAGLGASQLRLCPTIANGTVTRLIESDPDSNVYQFVVTAQPATTWRGDDALAPLTVNWPDLDAETAEQSATIAALEHERDALRSEVEAWQHSRLVRATNPLRRLRARFHARH